MSKVDRKLDQAARAAWLYYVAGKTQNEIADLLNVSRQAAQRLVALATEQRLVQVAVRHPVSDCMNLSEQIKNKFGLSECYVVPSSGLDVDSVQQFISVAASEVMQKYLAQPEPLTIAVGSGRALRAAIDELPDMNYTQHTCVSMIGAIASDGSCTRYDVPLRFAEKTAGKYFILPAPMFADSVEDKIGWTQHRIYQTVLQRAEEADVAFIGIGQMRDHCPLQEDGFITDVQLNELQEKNSVAELLGHFIGEDGERISTSLNECLTSVALTPNTNKKIIAFAGGAEKYVAMRAVLRGRWLSGLVTDEDTATHLLSAD